MRRLADAEAEFDLDAPQGESWAERIARRLIERAALGDTRSALIVLDRIDGRVEAAHVFAKRDG